MVQNWDLYSFTGSHAEKGSCFDVYALRGVVFKILRYVLSTVDMNARICNIRESQYPWEPHIKFSILASWHRTTRPIHLLLQLLRTFCWRRAAWSPPSKDQKCTSNTFFRSLVPPFGVLLAFRDLCERPQSPDCSY